MTFYTETQVNTTTNGAQSAVDIVPLSTGGWVAVWTQINNNFPPSYSVMGQVFDATGSKVGVERTLGSETSAWIGNPAAVAIDGDNIVVSWAVDPFPPGQGQGQSLQATIISTTSVVSAQATVATGSQTIITPAVTGLSGGGYVLTWAEDNGNGVRNIKHRVYDDSGNPATNALPANTTTTLNNYTPSIAALPDGGYVIVWTTLVLNQGEQFSHFELMMQRFTSDGAADGAEIAVNSTSLGTFGTSSVAVAEDGSIIVVWTGNDGGSQGIFQNHFDAQGVASGEERVNQTTTGEQTDPSVTILADGGWVVTFTSEDQSGTGVMQHRYDSSGNSVNSDTLVNTTETHNQAGSDILALPDGGWLVAWTSDQQDGSSNGVFMQRFSSDGSHVSVTAPTSENGSVSVASNLTHVFSTADFTFADADGDAFYSVLITSLPANGTLSYMGVELSNGVEVVVGDLSQLVYTPDAQHVGQGAASFGYTVVDAAGSISSAYTMTIDVGQANSAPTGADISVNLNEDSTFTFDTIDFASIFADQDQDTLAQIEFVTSPSGGTFAGDGVELTKVAIADLAHVSWKPAANQNGTGLDSLTFRLIDSVGLSSDTYTLTFDVDPVNDAPKGASSTISVTGGGTHAFQESDFGFSDIDGDDLASVTITVLPTVGTLTLDGDVIKADDVVAAADLTKLVWTPPDGESGTGLASLSFKVTDPSGAKSSEHTLTFDVTAVQHDPTGTDSTKTIKEDSTFTFKVSDFGYSDADNDTLGAVAIDKLPLNGTLLLDGQTVSAGEKIMVADLGKLTFTPAANANGKVLASVSFMVMNSTGIDKSPNTITFNVVAVNDAPDAADKIVTIDEDKARTFRPSDFGFKDVDGDKFDHITITALPGNGKLTLDGVAVTKGRNIDVDDLSSLVFTPAEDAFGTKLASFGFTVSDNGGRASGGQNTSGVHTITFNVTEVADERLGTSDKDTITGDGGRDVLRGLGEADILNGKGGNDRIVGGRGADTMTGGDGTDTFVFADAFGDDTITDFNAKGADHDVLDLSRSGAITSFADLKADHIEKTSGGLLISDGDGNTIFLQGVALRDLDADDVLF